MGKITDKNQINNLEKHLFHATQRIRKSKKIKNPGATAPGKTKNQLNFKQSGNFIPVDQRPECFHIIRTAILVVEVVGMFPHVDTQNG